MWSLKEMALKYNLFLNFRQNKQGSTHINIYHLFANVVFIILLDKEYYRYILPKTTERLEIGNNLQDVDNPKMFLFIRTQYMCCKCLPTFGVIV